MRLRLLSIAGRLATIGRRTWLHLDRPAPRTALALDVLRRLEALAPPADRDGQRAVDPRVLGRLS